MTQQILIIDDYPQLVSFLTDRLVSEGYQVVSASTGNEGLEIIKSGFVGVVLLDVRLPDGSGLDFFLQIKKIAPNLPVIVVSAHANIDMAVEATKRGAFDFIAKGSDLLKRLHISVKNAFEKLSMSEKLATLQTQLTGKYELEHFITVNPKMREILNTVTALMNSNVAVLIEGESGTGKELIARAIHLGGQRAGGPFVVVNCAGIPETLLESEMFGYEKGAFTGALARKIGKFEAANGGSIFLDEVGELPKSLQSKLLRVLQDHTFERIGGNETISVDVRVISATNRDLVSQVKKGEFREDLYFRIAGFPIRIPPLRERKDDILVLSQHFLKRFAQEEHKNIVGFNPTALSLLEQYSFPGNVRELENLIRRMVIISSGPHINKEDVVSAMSVHSEKNPTTPSVTKEIRSLEERIAMAFPTIDAIVPMKELQIAYLKRVLEVSEGNVSKAARALNVGRATLYRWNKGEGFDE